MLTKNINLVNFSKFKRSPKIKREFNKFKKIDWINSYKLLNSFTESYKYSYSKEKIKKFKKFKLFRVIGMGGSILGAEAIYNFLKTKIKKKFFFINNLEANNESKKYNKGILNIIISKSGNTLETLANLNLIKNSNKNSNIFVTEKKESTLNQIARKLQCEVIEHKNFIGGRYSVLSEVGMLPAELMGLNEKKFKKFNQLIKNENFINNLIINVQFILKYIKQGKFNSIILNYDESSNKLFQWYQQLVAESLGKKSKGLLPVISTMPKDNHSLLQLYLDGPKKNFFTFFSVHEKSSELINNKEVILQNRILKNKTIFNIIQAQKKATENIFRIKKLPFRSFDLKNRNEETLGELFCFFVLEVILIGKALKVNAFDQPSVELIKTETKKILS